MIECGRCGKPRGEGEERSPTASISGSIMGDEYTESWYYCPGCQMYTLEDYRDRFSGEDKVSVRDPIDKANFTPEDRQQIANDYKRASPLFVYATQDIPDLTGDIHKISTPTLVIWGDKDRTLKAGSFPHLVRTVPNATGYIVTGCGHQPHIGQPTLVNNKILAFLNNIREVDSTQPPK